jgi:hypothetical protein
LQFNNIAKLTQLQILVHDTKVPSSISLGYYMPDGPDVLSTKLKLTNIKFQNLGEVEFQARELKTISMSTATLLLKMTING